MNITINYHKHYYDFTCFLNKKVYNFQFNNLEDAFGCEEFVKIIANHKAKIAISPALFYHFRETYPLISRNKILQYHFEKYQKVYNNNLPPTIIKMKKFKHEIKLVTYHLYEEVIQLLQQLHVKANISMIGSNEKFNQYLYLSDSLIAFWYLGELFYYSADLDQNTNLIGFNLIKVMYQLNITDKVFIINLSTKDKYLSLNKYLNQNKEPKVELVEV